MSGNGVDLASIYGAILAQSAELKALRADMLAELEAVRSEMATGFAEIRQEVRGYHAAVMGHGIMLTEHDERITRLERGELPPKAA